MKTMFSETHPPIKTNNIHGFEHFSDKLDGFIEIFGEYTVVPSNRFEVPGG